MYVYIYISIYIYIFIFMHLDRLNLVISPAWIYPWSTVIKTAFLFAIYLFVWNSSVKSVTVMMSAVNQKPPCLFIRVCSVKVYYTVSEKNKTPTGFRKAGKPWKTLTSAIFVFKRSLRQVQETKLTDCGWGTTPANTEPKWGASCFAVQWHRCLVSSRSFVPSSWSSGTFLSQAKCINTALFTISTVYT